MGWTPENGSDQRFCLRSPSRSHLTHRVRLFLVANHDGHQINQCGTRRFEATPQDDAEGPHFHHLHSTAKKKSPAAPPFCVRCALKINNTTVGSAIATFPRKDSEGQSLRRNGFRGALARPTSSSSTTARSRRTTGSNSSHRHRHPAHRGRMTTSRIRTRQRHDRSPHSGLMTWARGFAAFPATHTPTGWCGRRHHQAGCRTCRQPRYDLITAIGTPPPRDPPRRRPTPCRISRSTNISDRVTPRPAPAPPPSKQHWR